MLETAKKLYALLHPGDRSKVILLVLLMIVTAFVQTAGVASIMPFLAVLSDPAIIETKPWLSRAYERLGFSSPTGFLQFLGFAAFVVFVTGTALQALTQWAVTRYSSLQQYHLSYRLMEEYLRRPYEFYLQRNSGDLSKTVLQETGQAITAALLPAMRLLSYTLLAVSVVVLLIIVEPWLAIGVATTLGTAYGSIYLISKRWLNRIGKDRVVANRERFTTASEAFAGAKEIRLLGRERDYLQRFGDPSRRFAMHQANVTLLSNLPQYAIEGIAFGGVLLLILYLMSDGGIASALPLIGLYGLAGKQLIPAFQKIFSTVAALRFNMPAVETVLEDLNAGFAQPLPKTPSDPTRLTPAREIVLRNVTYRYPNAEKPALDKLSISIAVNTTIGMVGSSGAGKSTLVDLVLGLLEPESGDVLIDDTVLDSTNKRNWQATLGYVPQHIFLADQSVSANIALGLPAERIDKQAVERAARLANLHDFIVQDMPQGYDTVIGERGVRLSGGQRQRIGIARALYRDPSVIVFDEATSALDNTTERAVMDAIHTLSGNKTIILIAHRLTTIEECDRIYVLSEGRVVESGSWELLSNQDSHLSRLASGEG